MKTEEAHEELTHHNYGDIYESMAQMTEFSSQRIAHSLEGAGQNHCFVQKFTDRREI